MPTRTAWPKKPKLLAVVSTKMHQKWKTVAARFALREKNKRKNIFTKTRGHVLIATSAAWPKKQTKLPAAGISTKNA